LLPSIVAIGSCTRPKGAFAAAFLFLGTISYGLYILHATAILIVRTAWPELQAWQGVIVLCSLAIIVALLDAVYDVPIRRRLNAIIFGP
jgi:peptidoglycan/LPS O-acetylase OafA/YrhL